MGQEWICRCKRPLHTPALNELPEFDFIEGHEYQVDIFDLFYQVYANGGWRDYVFLSKDEFNEHFELIDGGGDITYTYTFQEINKI